MNTVYRLLFIEFVTKDLEIASLSGAWKNIRDQPRTATTARTAEAETAKLLARNYKLPKAKHVEVVGSARGRLQLMVTS